MTITFRASASYLLRHPWQLLLAVLGITIGVAVMVAVDLANVSARKAFVTSMNSINGEATHQIIGGPGGIDEAVYVRLRVDGGLQAIAPIVAGEVRVNDRTLHLLGVDPFAERQFRQFSTAPISTSQTTATSRSGAEGVIRRFLAGEGQVLMSAQLATDLDLSTGDAFALQVSGKPFEARVGGILRQEQLAELPNILVADVSMAQEWLGMVGKLSRIDVKVMPADELSVARVRALVPPGTELLSATGRVQTTADMSDAFMTNLFAMSLLAILVGLFLIYNSVSFMVLQRRGLIGVLRALGVTREQIFRLILIEALLIGVVGAALGVAGGIWLGEKLLALVSRTISDHYFAVTVTDVAIGFGSVFKGFAVGLGATLVAAAIPAAEASSYRPRLALSRSVLESRTGRWLPRFAVAGGLLMCLAVIVLFASGKNLAAGLVALFLLVLGFAFCIPMFVSFASLKLSPVAGKIAGTVGHLAVGGVRQSLSRTGVAVVALAIAISATIGVSIMVESFRQSVTAWLNTTLQSDVYVGVPRGSLDPELIDEIVSQPLIEAFSTSRRSWLETDSGRIRVVALQMAPGSYAGTTIRGGNSEAVWRQFDSSEGVLISDALAYRNNLSRGDTIEINTAIGSNAFTIAAVYQSYDSNGGAMLMSRRTYDQFFDDPAIDSLGIYLSPGADASRVVEDIRAISAGRQSLMLSSNARIREMSLQIFDRTFVVTNVLYWLTVTVAVIGILGAMLALQLERSKEFGILRAIGMTPAQTGTLVGIQSGFIGLLSGVAAVPLGLTMAWLLINVINRRAFGWEIDFTLTPMAVLWAVLLAFAAGTVAGLYPARLAARTRPALAMRDE